MDTITVVKSADGWTLSDVSGLPVGVSWADEGHFQRKCLELSVPVVFSGLLHAPLCAEFPRHPGIDLMFLHPAGYLILAEVKLRNYNAEDLIQQTIGEYWAARSATVAGLLRYLRTKPIGHDVAEGAVAMADAWIRRQNIATSTTIEQLYERNLVVLAALVEGRPSLALLNAAHPPVVVYGIQTALSLQLAGVYADSRNYRPSNDVSAATAVRLTGQAYAERIFSSGGRRSRPAQSEVESFFAGPKAPAEVRYLYKKLLQKDYQMKAGSDANYSVMAQPLDATGARRTLLRLFGRGSIELPGNLYQQQRLWGVDEAAIDELLQRVSRLFPARLLNWQAGKNLEISIDGVGANVSIEDLNKVIASLDAFLAKSQQRK